MTADRCVLVTGATGFIGRALVADLARARFNVRAASRSPAPGAVAVGELGRSTDWRAALDGVAAVVHLAGPAHARFSEAQLNRAIVEGAAALVEQASAAGVARFVYMSSIKAAADESDAPLSENEEARPADAYGRAKRDAELIVLQAARMAPIVLRPPLVHGAEAKANVARLLALADSPAPLPLAGFKARRSVIALGSLVAAIRAVLSAPDGASGVFHLADRPALTIGDMIAALRHGLGRAPGLFALAGVAALAPRVLRTSLVVDDARFRMSYGYGEASHIRSTDALAATAAAWKAQR